MSLEANLLGDPGTGANQYSNYAVATKRSQVEVETEASTQAERERDQEKRREQSNFDGALGTPGSVVQQSARRESERARMAGRGRWG
jgi:hypothetical protein